MQNAETRRALELADLIETRLIPQRLQGEPMLKVLATWETWQAVLSALRSTPECGDQGAEAMQLTGPWPIGCVKPNSCARHRQCMYAQSPEMCRHLGQDLTSAIEAAKEYGP